MVLHLKPSRFMCRRSGELLFLLLSNFRVERAVRIHLICACTTVKTSLGQQRTNVRRSHRARGFRSPTAIVARALFLRLTSKIVTLISYVTISP